MYFYIRTNGSSLIYSHQTEKGLRKQTFFRLVGAVRLELMTSCMSSMRSNQLSYVPKAIIYYHIFFLFTSD